jgi:regulator of protease activity HflC (stomatin/prohibitin superfamily)
LFGDTEVIHPSSGGAAPLGWSRTLVDVGWIVFLAVAIPLLAIVAWVVFDDSFVQIEPGQLGLLIVRGKATNRALEPGPHWVPAVRRRMVQAYPSLELSFRAGIGATAAPTDLERGGPAPQVVLGDRAAAVVSYTVRFQLDRAMLREIHNRFGPEGIWAAVQDEAARAVRAALAQPSVGVDDLFGPARTELERRVGDAVAAALAQCGLVVTMFGFGDLDLGELGDVIQATARARHVLAREEAEAAMRVARARIDADLAPYLADPTRDIALRYREIDAWQRVADRAWLVQPGSRPAATPATPDTADAAAEPAPEPPPEPTLEAEG